MDRGQVKRKEDININKVVDKIGQKEKVKYDSIDVYVDANNKDNVWAIAHYSTYLRKKRVLKDQIIKFNNYNEMFFFLQNNFDTYELNNYVDYSNRCIFLRKVDYLGMDYYLHDGRPDLNYIEIKYKEYINDGFHIRQVRIPKEYDQILKGIINENRKNSPTSIDNDFYREIKVNEKKEPFIDEDNDRERLSRKERRTIKEKSKMPMAPKNSHKIRNLIIYASTIAILTTGGIALKKNSEYKKEVISQENQGVSLHDFHISYNKDKAFSIINDLMINDYQNITLDDLEFLFDYVKKVNLSNYDNNKSGAFFNYQEYFDPIIWNTSSDSAMVLKKCGDVLKNVEEKYRNSFKVVDNKLMLKESSVKEYIDYVASLTFMYDTMVDQRNSGQAQFENQSITSIYAPKDEVEAYNRFPKVLKYVILSQLKEMMSHSNYNVSYHPSNYRNGKEIDKNDLVNDVKKRIKDIEDSLRTDCCFYEQKTI